MLACYNLDEVRRDYVKKIRRKLLMLSVLFISVLFGSVNRVQAVTTESVIEAMQERIPTLDWSAMALEGKLDIAMSTATQSADLAQIKGDFRYDFTEALQMEGHLNILSPFASNLPAFSLYYLDGVSYSTDGQEWYVQNNQKTEAEIRKELQKTADQFDADLHSITTEQIQFIDTYMNLDETTEYYAFHLKTDIDPQAMWDDLQELVDIESLQENVDQLDSYGELDGIEAYEDLADYEAFATFITSNPVLELRFEKENYRPTYFLLDVSVDPEAYGAESSDFGTVNVRLELNFSDFGQTFDVIVPSEALESTVDY